jgi:hypothetical protein
MMVTPSGVTAALAAFLKGEDVAWNALGLTSVELLEACAHEDLTGLVHQKLCRLRRETDWPDEFRAELTREVRAEAARELLRQREITSVLKFFAVEGVYPILLKGTPLAYSLYETPSSRTRCDTDLLVPREQVDSVRRVITGLGYSAPVFCGGELLFCQCAFEKTDAFGVYHGFDVHWKISTQAAFADILTYEELAAEAAPIPALGHHARGAGSLHALLLACIHPVMHHRNVERLIWIYDIHLLASQLSSAEFAAFVDLAVVKKVAAIVEHGLALARSNLKTAIPDRVMSRLASAGPSERSAVYLQTGRRWHDELISSLGWHPRWRDRVRLLREVVLPEPDYMLKAYGITIRRAAAILLPLLYLHRGVYGAWKVVSGRK